MDLKIKDVAELLNVSENTIRRWLTDGRIPAYRINQQHLFSRTEIEDWMIRDRDGLAAAAEERHDTNTFSLGNKQFSLYRALHKGNVLTHIPGKTKEEVICTAMKKMAVNMELDADVVTELLLDREKLQPTALGNGIALPHTRDFLLDSHHDVVAVVYPETPIDYQALDGQLVDIMIFLFACDDKRHLHLLAKIAHLATQPYALAFLRTHPNKEALLAFIKDWEAKVA